MLLKGKGMNNSKDIYKEQLVSIIMPAYNCQKYIYESIKSVKEQLYEQWELIIVDDCSTDNTSIIIEKIKESDSRIKLYNMKENVGAAMARNYGVENAKGKYIAFLDSDDLWHHLKLQKQITYMEKYNVNFTCTSYNKIDEMGIQLNKIIHVQKKIEYNELLKDNCGNSTVIYNSEKLGKFFIPNIKKRNDYVMWLKILKTEKYLYGIDDVLGSHRVRSGSLSENKISLIKYHWLVYRKIEKLTLIKSSYLIMYWGFKSIFKS